MGVILKQKPRRLDDLPRTEAAKKERGPLDESEGEEEEPELVPDGAASGGADGVEKALLQLTKIATKLTEPKEKKDWFDSLVEGGSGSAASSGEAGAPSSRRNAAAMRALQKALVERPKQIYQSIEANLAADFMARAVVSGEPFAAGATTRGWLTARSRVQNYTNQVRWSWQVCGIWDALIAGRAEGGSCSVRCIDRSQRSKLHRQRQLAISQQCSFGSTPTIPGIPAPQSPQSTGALQHTVLLEPRWVEVLMGHLKEIDTFLESKKKLGGRPGGGSKSDKEKEDDAAARAKAKAKAKQERYERAKRQREQGGPEGSGTVG